MAAVASRQKWRSSQIGRNRKQTIGSLSWRSTTTRTLQVAAAGVRLPRWPSFTTEWWLAKQTRPDYVCHELDPRKGVLTPVTRTITGDQRCPSCSSARFYQYDSGTGGYGYNSHRHHAIVQHRSTRTKYLFETALMTGPGRNRGMIQEAERLWAIAFGDEDRLRPLPALRSFDTEKHGQRAFLDGLIESLR